MRRFKKERQFKGSIFATFVDRETAEKFVKDEDSKTFKDKPLTKLLQDEYWVYFNTLIILSKHLILGCQNEGNERKAPR